MPMDLNLDIDAKMNKVNNMKNTETQNYENNSKNIQSNTGGGIVMTNNSSTDNNTQNDNENDTDNETDQSNDQSTSVSDSGSGISMDVIILILGLVGLYIYNKKYRR